MRAEVKHRIDAAQNDFINLSDINIDDGEVEEIVAAIQKKYPKVTEISFEQNNIGDRGAAILGSKLNTLTNLAKINLQFNQIDKTGAQALFTLKNSHPEIVIALHGNLITNTGEMAKIENAAADFNAPQSKR